MWHRHKKTLSTRSLRVRPSARPLRVERLEDRRLLSIDGWVANSVPVEGTDPGWAIEVDPGGNSYVTGHFAGAVRFDDTTLTSSGSNDVFVAKLDPDGNFLWAVAAGGTGDDRAWDIAIDAAGNSYITGVFGGTATIGPDTLVARGGWDILVAKVSPSGEFLWAKRAGGVDGDHGRQIAVDALGTGVYVTAKFISEADFGDTTLTSAGGEDGALLKLSPSGTFLWTRHLGPTGGDGRAEDVVVNSAGDVYVSWWNDEKASVSKLDPLNGDFVWERNDIASGWLALHEEAGTTFVYNYGDDAFYKLRDEGSTAELLWSRPVTFLPNYAWDIATDLAGNVYATGRYLEEIADFDPGPGTAALSAQTGCFFILKLDPAGNFVNVRQSAAFDGQSFGIAVDATGNIYTTGHYSGVGTLFDIGTEMVPPTAISGMFVLKTTQEMGSIFGMAFNDLDRDGQWDVVDPNGDGFWDRWDGTETGEPSLFGSTVYLDGYLDGVLNERFDAGELTATVQENGEYRFSHVRAGTHVVRLYAPAGFTQDYPEALPSQYTVSVVAGGSATDADFSAYTETVERTYQSTDVPKKIPSRRWQTIESVLNVSDSYPVYGLEVSVTLSGSTGGVALIAPDGTAVGLPGGTSTVHVNIFNTRPVNGTWKLSVRGTDQGTGGSLTAWSLKVLGPAAQQVPPTLSINDVSVTEGAAGTTTPANLTVTRSGDLSQFLSVSYQTVGVADSATYTDFERKTDTLTFQPGEASRTIGVTVIGDNTRESNEFFYVNLSILAGRATLADGQGKVTIINDDGGGGKKSATASTSAGTKESLLASTEVGSMLIQAETTSTSSNPGELDDTFDGDGVALAAIGGGAELGALALQPDGKIVVAGYSRGARTDQDFTVARFSDTGSLDTTFGSGGTVRLSLSKWIDSANAVLVQPDGKIIAAGQTNLSSSPFITDANYAMVLVRLNSNGTLDTSFGGKGAKGKVIFELQPDPLLDEGINSLALQPDGKIVAAGISNGAMAIVRFNTNGTRDTSFGSQGAVLVDVGGPGALDRAHHVIILPDGDSDPGNNKILIAGETNPGDVPRDAVFARLNSNGTPDTTFGGGDGIVISDVIDGGGSLPNSAYDLALQDDRKFVVTSPAEGRFLVVRYKENGELDDTFGQDPNNDSVRDGYVFTDLPGHDATANSVVVDSAGRIVVSGTGAWYVSGYGWKSDAALIRYTSDGELDGTFGTGGVVITNLVGYESETMGALWLDADGKILATGSAMNLATGSRETAIYRFHGGDAPAAPATAVDPGLLTALSYDRLQPQKETKLTGYELAALDMVFAEL
ncbi:MAG: hypothetical protein HUU20_13950 [Pirellulales bacterium]|nr:hypothetical protein [Pirellulales bacterium]